MRPPEFSSRRERVEHYATLGTGLFTNSVWDMLSVVIPLYGVAVGLGAGEIGIVVAARSMLPALLSIHGGILMDQLGTRRVLLGVAAATSMLPLLYPLAGWFALLVVLQLLLGLAASFGMAASQTLSMQTSHGDTALLARFSIVTRVGTFLGPVVIGAVWDLFGAWPAFGCISACGAGVVAAALWGPKGAPERPQGLSVAAVLLPRWEPHREAFVLAMVPSVAFILAASFLRNSSGAIQGSLYVVYLDGIGVSGTIIGTLVAFAELFGVVGSLMAAWAERRMRSDRLLLWCVAAALTAIVVTPLIGGFVFLLFMCSAVRGIAQGMSQPLMFSILTHGVPGNRHGVSVGLRNAVVRFASIVTPAAMGLAAEAWGIVASFYVIGAVFLSATAALAVVSRRVN